MHADFTPKIPPPNWLSPPPQGAVQTLWSICPSVLIYYHAKNKRSMVAKKYFLPLFCKQKSKPLTACFMHGFCKSPTEHLPRGRAVGTRPTRGFRGFPLASLLGNVFARNAPILRYQFSKISPVSLSIFFLLSAWIYPVSFSHA